MLVVTFAARMKPFCICSFFAQLPSLSGALLVKQLVHPPDLVPFPNSSSGSPSISQLVGMSKLRVSPLFAGQSGSSATKPASKKKLIKSPIELISYFVVFMKFWAGLHNNADAEALRAGADALLNLATSVGDAGHARPAAHGVGPLLLEDVQDRGDGDGDQMEEDNDAA